jgi:hypothetical protein
MTVIYDLSLKAGGSHIRVRPTCCEGEVIYDHHRRYQLLVKVNFDATITTNAATLAALQ